MFDNVISVQAAQDAVHQVAESTKETTNVGKRKLPAQESAIYICTEIKMHLSVDVYDITACRCMQITYNRIVLHTEYSVHKFGMPLP